MGFVKITKQQNHIEEADMKLDKKDVLIVLSLFIMVDCSVRVAICD